MNLKKKKSLCKTKLYNIQLFLSTNTQCTAHADNFNKEER